MTQTGKTTAFVLIASALTAGAAVVSIPRVATVEDFRDQGQPFFPEFRDPSECTSLEVIEVDPKTAEPRIFKVMRKNGRWVIPSHFNYPADAKDRLARTAAQVIDLTKDTVRSSRSEDHALLGVLDPLDMKSANIEGLGKRISLRDKSDRVLAEYIIGKDVPNRPGQKYVRRPGQVRTYGVNLKVDLSVNFADWIEPNLLDIEPSTVRQVTFDNRKVDVERQALLPGDIFSIHRQADGAPWTTEGLPLSLEIDPTKTSAMVKALGDLKIVGVRPKPEGMSSLLSGELNPKVDARQFRSLLAHGFYPTTSGMRSDEGTVEAVCETGIVYKLQFGKVKYGQGESVSAGKDEDPFAAPTNESGANTGKLDSKDDAVESRFLVVTVKFDPTQLPTPKGPSIPPPGELPNNVFRNSGAEIREAATRYTQAMEAWKTRKKLAEDRLAMLTKRFEPWYYLVPGNDYRALVFDRKQIIRDRQSEDSPAGHPNPFAPGRSRPTLPPFSPTNLKHP